MRSAPSWVVVLWLALPSAGCGYQPGSFSGPRAFPGQRAAVGCLDLAVERRSDEMIGPVLAYQFGNRCDQLAIVDLAAVSVVLRDRDGDEHALRPYDPRHELRALWIDGRSSGSEAIAYESFLDAVRVCADVGPIARGDVLRRAPFPTSWLCFDGPYEPREAP